MLASEPQPVVDRRPYIVVMLLKEARRPVGVTPTKERILIPPRNVTGNWFGYSDIGVHGTKHANQLLSYFFFTKYLGSLSPITL